MKKVLTMLLVAGIFGLVACGPSADETTATEAVEAVEEVAEEAVEAAEEATEEVAEHTCSDDCQGNFTFFSAIKNRDSVIPAPFFYGVIWGGTELRSAFRTLIAS